MKPATRRVVQALLYEVGAIAVVGPSLALVFDKPAATTLALAIAMSAVALAWNYLYNSLFERWEARQVRRGRSLLRRLAHSTGFEGGLVLMLVPLSVWWLDISVLAALAAELGVLLFFFVYSLAFTWVFDRLFGLPASAS